MSAASLRSLLLTALAAAPLLAQAPPAIAPPTPPASSQQPAQGSNRTYTLRQSARLVILDFVVTDAQGHVVNNLRREDFHVTEADEAQTILNFEQAGTHTPALETDIESTADLDRLAPRAPVNIILLDEFNTRFEDMAFARYSLKKYLEKQPGKLSTPTMLVAVNLQHFTVLRDYTQNTSEILSALDHHFATYPWQAHNYGWIAERYVTAFETLRQVAQATIGHQGHKNMIWIGRGFPSFDLTRSANIDAEHRIDNAVQQCVNELRDARVTLYTIDPAGVMVDPGKYGEAAAEFDPMGGNYQFNRLASATGGRTLYGRNDVNAEIDTAIQDGSSFYTLTYRPTNSSLDPQKFRRIKVTVDRPGLSVLTRQGYYLQYGPGRINPENPSRRLLADLGEANASSMVYDGAPLQLETDPNDPENFTIHIDGRGLSWTNATATEPRHTQVILIASTFDRKGKPLQQIGKIITVDASEGVPPTGRLIRGVDLRYKLPHNSKAVRARFTVRVTATGRIGTLDAPLNQPPTTTPAVSP